MTRLRSLDKMTQLRKMQTPRMAVLFCKGGGGEGGKATRFTMNTPSTCSAKEEEQSGIPTLSRELTHCRRVAWRFNP